jgi:hypothetical protein
MMVDAVVDADCIGDRSRWLPAAARAELRNRLRAGETRSVARPADFAANLARKLPASVAKTRHMWGAYIV